MNAGEYDLVAVANRLPVDFTVDESGELSWTRSPGGLVTALEPMMQAADGAWVGWAAATSPICMALSCGRSTCTSPRPTSPVTMKAMPAVRTAANALLTSMLAMPDAILAAAGTRAGRAFAPGCRLP